MSEPEAGRIGEGGGGAFGGIFAIDMDIDRVHSFLELSYASLVQQCDL